MGQQYQIELEEEIEVEEKESALKRVLYWAFKNPI